MGASVETSTQPIQIWGKRKSFVPNVGFRRCWMEFSWNSMFPLWKIKIRLTLLLLIVLCSGKKKMINQLNCHFHAHQSITLKRWVLSFLLAMLVIKNPVVQKFPLNSPPDRWRFSNSSKRWKSRNKIWKKSHLLLKIQTNRSTNSIGIKRSLSKNIMKKLNQPSN